MTRRELLALGLVALAAGPASAVEPEPFDPRRPAPDQRRRLLAGEVLSLSAPERTDLELAAMIVARVAAPLPAVGEYFAVAGVVSADATITASGPLGGGASDASLSGFRYGAGDLGEIEALLDAAPGVRFNLGLSEIDGFRALKGTVPSADRSAQAEAVSRQYRALALDRWQLYQQSGLGAMPPYARRPGGGADPAAMLRSAADDALLVTAALPGLRDLLLTFPAGAGPRVTSRYYWVRRTVQGRPTLIVIHRLVDTRRDAVGQVERHVYVGHSYDTTQIITAGLADEDGTLIVATGRVWTEQVAGFGSELKRAIGRRQVRAELVARLDHLRAAVERAVAAVGRSEPVQAP